MSSPERRSTSRPLHSFLFSNLATAVLIAQVFYLKHRSSLARVVGDPLAYVSAFDSVSSYLLFSRARAHLGRDAAWLHEFVIAAIRMV
jgi:hypothetical protein